MKRILKTLALAIYFTFSFALYASADPANWSESDNRCPKVSDGFEREVSTVTGTGGTYYVCYWFDNNNVHNLTMRPLNIMGGFNRAADDERGKSNLIKRHLFKCAKDYVDNKGFCGEV
jgi:hypothetical protein